MQYRVKYPFVFQDKLYQVNEEIVIENENLASQLLSFYAIQQIEKESSEKQNIEEKQTRRRTKN